MHFVCFLPSCRVNVHVAIEWTHPEDSWWILDEQRRGTGGRVLVWCVGGWVGGYWWVGGWVRVGQQRSWSWSAELGTGWTQRGCGRSSTKADWARWQGWIRLCRCTPKSNTASVFHCAWEPHTKYDECDGKPSPPDRGDEPWNCGNRCTRIKLNHRTNLFILFLEI